MTVGVGVRDRAAIKQVSKQVPLVGVKAEDALILLYGIHLITN